MNVRDILKTKPALLVVIKPSQSVSELSLLLREKNIGAVVVSSDGVSIEGVVSERDVAYALCTRSNIAAAPVAELMTRNVVACSPDDTVGQVAATMRSRRIRHLPVVEGGRLIGMVSIRDVLYLRVDELQQQTAQFRTLIGMGNGSDQDRE